MRTFHTSVYLRATSFALATFLLFGTSFEVTAQDRPTETVAAERFGYCWARGVSGNDSRATLTQFSTNVFRYDRWHLDEGRYFKAQFETHVRDTLKLTGEAVQLECESDRDSVRIFDLFEGQPAKAFSAGVTAWRLIAWAPHARVSEALANAKAIPPTAATTTVSESPSVAQSATATRADASAIATPAELAGRLPETPEVKQLGALSDEELINLAYYREQTCEGLISTQRQNQARARDQVAEVEREGPNKRNERRRENWANLAVELAETWRRMGVLLKAVQEEKRCPG